MGITGLPINIMMSQVVIKKCSSYNQEEVFRAISDGLNLLGGIEKFIKPTDKVLLKPNLLLESTPEQGVVTHKEVVRAVARILKNKCAKIYLGDGPSVWGTVQDINKVFLTTGMKEVADSEGIELVSFDSRVMKNGYPVTTWLDQVDKIINLPKFKSHDLMILTAAIKNLFGVIPGLHKKELHLHHVKAQDFAKILVDIFLIAKPAINIVDGIMGIEGDGPGRSGILKNMGVIVMGEDALSIDSILAIFMHLKPENILTNVEASKRGIGVMDPKKIEILGEKLPFVLPKTFKLPKTAFYQKMPEFVIKLAKALIKIWPFCIKEKCIKCGKCIKSCPKNVISFNEDKNIVFDYSSCIRCFCCAETCPVAAIDVRRSVFARLLKY